MPLGQLQRDSELNKKKTVQCGVQDSPSALVGVIIAVDWCTRVTSLELLVGKVTQGRHTGIRLASAELPHDRDGIRAQLAVERRQERY